MIHIVKINDYSYSVGSLNFDKPDADGDVQITIEDNYTGDVYRWISLAELERVVAWMKKEV